MPITQPFDHHTDRYEQWFERHPHLYAAELRVVRMLLPENGEGLEIGVGTGRFAGPLGVGTGVEPSAPMRAVARKRGIHTVEGVAEQLPFADESFDFALMVTTICFVDDPLASLREARRVIRPGGVLLIGYVDRDSPLGRRYERHKASSLFYGPATFYSTQEVVDLLTQSGFVELSFAQTILEDPELVGSSERVKPGYGEGSFVTVRAARP